MRRIRIFALGFLSFFAVLMSALLAPGTFVNRALSAALCTVFSFNSTVCTVNLAQSGDRVVAASPPAVERNISDWLVQRAPGEFDDAPSVPPASNPQAPPFPQDPGPNQPVRPDFDNPNGGNPDSNTGKQPSNLSSAQNPVYVFYVNGVQTTSTTYAETIEMIKRNLTNSPNFQFALTDTYNYGGEPLGDISESALQEFFQKSISQDGSKLENRIVDKIKEIDIQESEKAKQSCESKKRARFLLIGHSQGTIFINNIALKLRNAFSKESEINKRTGLLAFAPFTNFSEVRESPAFNLKYLLRRDDFPALGIISFLSPRVSSKYIPWNLECLKSNCPFALALKAKIERARISHYIGNYLGEADPKEYDTDANNALDKAKAELNMLLKELEPGEYEKKKECSQQVEQTPQPQQTAQKPSITVTITGPNVIEVNQKTTVEVKFVDPACSATSVTLWPPSLALPRLEKPIPAASACGGTISFIVGRIGDNSYGCGEYKNVFNAEVSGTSPPLSAYSPPVTVKHKPGSQDYWSCYAWPLE